MKTPDKKIWLQNFDVNKKLNANQFSIVAGVRPQSIRDAMETGLIIADDKGMIFPADITNLKYLRKKITAHIKSPERREIDVELLTRVNTAWMMALTPKPKKKFKEFDWKKDVQDGDSIELYLKDWDDKFLKMVLFTWTADTGIVVSTFDSNVSVTLINNEIDKIFYDGSWTAAYIATS